MRREVTRCDAMRLAAPRCDSMRRIATPCDAMSWLCQTLIVGHFHTLNLCAKLLWDLAVFHLLEDLRLLVLHHAQEPLILALDTLALVSALLLAYCRLLLALVHLIPKLALVAHIGLLLLAPELVRPRLNLGVLATYLKPLVLVIKRQPLQTLNLAALLLLARDGKLVKLLALAILLCALGGPLLALLLLLMALRAECVLL
mmetsp:Transcript_3993/g.11596  ORF Transcript_3993/g.11596 Transcript_3993/m.11596 type:complete len:201 (+) Transcript_3993:165-767(+)